MTKILFSTVLFVLTSSSLALAALPSAIKAKVYDLDKKNVLYNYDHKLVTEGEVRTANNVFTDPSNNPVVVEKAVFDGEKLISYTIEQKQLGANGRVEVKGDKIEFAYTRDGKTKTDDEKYVSNFVIGPSLIPYMRKNWAALMKGDEVDVRFGVVDRLETVGFTLKKMGSKDYNGQKAVVIRMKPTSFIIAAIVKPLMFTLTADNERLLEIKGRALPKRKDGSSWKDLDAVTVYEVEPTLSK